MDADGEVPGRDASVGPEAYYPLFEMPGYVTPIEPGPDRTVVAAIYSPTGESSLVQLRIESR